MNLPVLDFADEAGFARWISLQPPDAPGAWIKLKKRASGVTGINRAQAIDVALCHGWIDGQAAPFSDTDYLIRFTPRRPRSKWSLVNRRRALELMAAGRMTPAGQAQVTSARNDGRWDQAYAPPSEVTIPPDLQASLVASGLGLQVFEALPKAERWKVLYALATVKRAETRLRHIAAVVARLQAGSPA